MRSLALALANIALLLMAGFGCTSAATAANAVSPNGPIEVTLHVDADVARFSLGDSNYKIHLKRITDSRCPANAKCIWQGELAAEMQLDRERSGSRESNRFTLGQLTVQHAVVLGASFELMAIDETTVTMRIATE